MNKSVITNRYIIGYVRKYLSPREDKDIRKEDILKIENGVIHFTTALNELLVTKNIKEFYVNDMCIDINTNTIQNTESLNVKNC